MQPWLTRPKFPMLRVRMAGSNLTITQQPYSFLARAACEDGADGAQSEDAGARSPRLLRTGAPVAGGRLLEGRTDAVDVQGCDAAGVAGSVAAQEEPQPAGAAWPVPLRIRAATGPPVVSNGAAAVEGKEGVVGGRLNAKLGEETHSVLLTETSTSVALHCLSCGSAAHESGEGAISGEGVEFETGDGSQHEFGRERRPYLVVNDGHSGFFTVQYECERSWELAVAAIEESVLNECETMGFVHDLILPLHEGVLIDRRAASSSISSRRESFDGGGEGSSCDVACLFSRLEKVVHLLRRDRGHPAWSTGQLFIWELLIMCASNELGEIYELSRARGELLLAQKRLGAETDGGQADKAVAADHLGAGMTSGEKSLAAARATDTLASMGNRIAAAAQRLRRITADVELACKEAEEHVRWHLDRVAFGVEQASEALQSLREMRDRLERSRAQLAWAQQNGVLEAVL